MLRAADDARRRGRRRPNPPRSHGARGSVERSAAAQAAERRLRGGAADDDDGRPTRPGRPMGFGSMLSGRSGLFGTALLAAAFYFFFMRGRGGGQRERRLGLVLPVLDRRAGAAGGGLVASGVSRSSSSSVWSRAAGCPIRSCSSSTRARVRSLQADIDTNASNATARRDLAKIWLEKHRPRRALPLLEQAIARDPDSIELLYLSGVAHLLAGDHEKAVEALVTVTHREPNFQYGEAYLRAADALMALGRWDDAADALERYVKINSSSVEGATSGCACARRATTPTGAQRRRRICATSGARCRLPAPQAARLVPALAVLGCPSEPATSASRTCPPAAPPPSTWPLHRLLQIAALVGLRRSASTASSA